VKTPKWEERRNVKCGWGVVFWGRGRLHLVEEDEGVEDVPLLPALRFEG
jgi:hypothetical protein